MAFGGRSYSRAGFSSLGVNPDVTVVPTGLSATASVTSVQVLTDATLGATGNAATSSLGTVTFKEM